MLSPQDTVLRELSTLPEDQVNQVLDLIFQDALHDG